MLVINTDTGIVEYSVNGVSRVIGNLNDDCHPYFVIMPDGGLKEFGVDFYREWLKDLRYQATIFKLEARIRELEQEKCDR
jgi:hypothetical protein